jgi:hypothetical protein
MTGIRAARMSASGTAPVRFRSLRTSHHVFTLVGVIIDGPEIARRVCDIELTSATRLRPFITGKIFFGH